MRSLIIFITLLFIFGLNINHSLAASITEELTQLNNLFKEGAITKEEFSKAKSILLKTETTKKKNRKEKKSRRKKEEDNHKRKSC